jgi:hypothetical protein
LLQISEFIYKSKDQQPHHHTNNTAEAVTPLNSIPDLPQTQIEFEQNTHDFGVIKDDKKQYTTFYFTNSGKEPLMILGAEGSCGCTVPTWPKDPIAPGKSGKIEVAFDPNGKLGEQSKIVTLTANTEPKTTILTVKATIVKSN